MRLLFLLTRRYLGSPVEVVARDEFPFLDINDSVLNPADQ